MPTSLDHANAPPGRRAAADAVDLGELWRDLLTGRVRVVDTEFSAEFSYLSLASKGGGAESPPLAAEFRILEDVLMGVPQKVVAIERDIATSTVAIACKRCLVFMGFGCRTSSSPPLLHLLVHAARGAKLVHEADAAALERPGDLVRRIAAPRLETVLLKLLSPAQYAVVRLLVQGMTHAEIASERRTSRRTIANQLSTVYRRLQVSGRADLVNYLVRKWYVPPRYAAAS